jgi:hypothetical protein
MGPTIVPKGAQFMLARAGVSPGRHSTNGFARFVATWGARQMFLAVMFLALGALAGLIVGRMTADAAGHREGACVALRMAAALGYLDDKQQRLVMHTLATALNPDVDLFPGGRRAIEQACEATAGRG